MWIQTPTQAFQFLGEDIPDPVEPFKKRFYVLANDYLLVSPTKGVIKRILEKAQQGRLVESEDYIQVHASLGKLTDSKKIGIRQFGRLDGMLETSYELFRKGEFAWRGWFAPNDVVDAQGNPKPKRKQRFDGSLLPKDFENKIAPHLGPTGWVLENDNDGFLITGCVLKK